MHADSERHVHATGLAHTLASTWGAVRLVHPFPVSIVVGTSIVLLVVAHGGNPGWSLLVRAGSVVLLSQVAVGALNDLSDRHVDAIGQPDKPIPSGLVRPRFALALILVSLIALIPLSATFGPLAFSLSIVGTCAGLAYDLWLKPTPFSLAGYLIGFLALITWIWTIASHLTAHFFFIYPAGALLLLSAHLAQSFPDIETDRRTGQKGLAASLGTEMTFAGIVAPVTIVALGGLAIGLRGGSSLGALFNAAALVLIVVSLSMRTRTLSSRTSRIVLFRLAAPTIALIVLGSLAALQVSG